ncbi:hypothetical protein LC048_08145 [Mesobacillus subterraneus]|uniref:hypothetical protein n=1 Tax=Mesobacillus subterraneus TaxID=285983 RepID=UPI001CFE0E11|nr:hypothetical protein [Mesobacillus subterraneus]WLR56828.1 hypothetical protein LC048_08145 [Mesobacillus subterraneus]
MKVLSASSKFVIGSALEGGFVYLNKGVLTQIGKSSFKKHIPTGCAFLTIIFFLI